MASVTSQEAKLPPALLLETAGSLLSSCSLLCVMNCPGPFACPSLQQLTLAMPDERCPLLQRTASERRKARRNVNQRFLTAMMEMGIPSEKVGHRGNPHPCRCTLPLPACCSLPLCMLSAACTVVAAGWPAFPPSLQTQLTLSSAVAGATATFCSSVLQAGHCPLQAELALSETGNVGVEVATEWLFSVPDHVLEKHLGSEPNTPVELQVTSQEDQRVLLPRRAPLQVRCPHRMLTG